MPKQILTDKNGKVINQKVVIGDNPHKLPKEFKMDIGNSCVFINDSELCEILDAEGQHYLIRENGAFKIITIENEENQRILDLESIVADLMIGGM